MPTTLDSLDDIFAKLGAPPDAQSSPSTPIQPSPLQQKGLVDIPEMDSQTGGHFKLDNKLATAFIMANNQYKQDHGTDIPITSTYRDPQRNKAVGGAQNSDHLRGDAFDINPQFVNIVTPYLVQHGFKPLGGTYFNPATGRTQSEDNHFTYMGGPKGQQIAASPTSRQNALTQLSSPVNIPPPINVPPVYGTVEDQYNQIGKTAFVAPIGNHQQQLQNALDIAPKGVQNLGTPPAKKELALPALAKPQSLDEIASTLQALGNKQPAQPPPEPTNFLSDLQKSYLNAAGGFTQDQLAKSQGGGWGSGIGNVAGTVTDTLAGGVLGGLVGAPALGIGAVPGFIGGAALTATGLTGSQEAQRERLRNEPLNPLKIAGAGLVGGLASIPFGGVGGTIGETILRNAALNAAVNAGGDLALQGIEQGHLPNVDIKRSLQAAALGGALGAIAGHGEFNAHTVAQAHIAAEEAAQQAAKQVEHEAVNTAGARLSEAAGVKPPDIITPQAKQPLDILGPQGNVFANKPEMAIGKDLPLTNQEMQIYNQVANKKPLDIRNNFGPTPEIIKPTPEPSIGMTPEQTQALLQTKPYDALDEIPNAIRNIHSPETLSELSSRIPEDRQIIDPNSPTRTPDIQILDKTGRPFVREGDLPETNISGLHAPLNEADRLLRTTGQLKGDVNQMIQEGLGQSGLRNQDEYVAARQQLQEIGTKPSRSELDIHSIPDDELVNMTRQAKQDINNGTLQIRPRLAQDFENRANTVLSGQASKGQLNAFRRDLAEINWYRQTQGLKQQLENVHTNVRDVFGTEFSPETGIGQQKEVDPNLQKTWDEVKDGLSLREQGIGEQLKLAAENDAKIDLKYKAEISGRTGRVVDSPDFTPINFFKTNKGIGVQGYNEAGHLSSYYITRTPEGSQLMGIDRIKNEAGFRGTAPNIYQGPREYNVSDVLGKEPRLAPIKTSEALATVGKLDEALKPENLASVNPESRALLERFRNKDSVTIQDVHSLRNALSESKTLKALCKVFGLV